MDKILGLAFVIIGYFFGCIQSGYIYGRLHGIDIREHGSKNSGATNSLRTMGKKAGIIVLTMDFLKAILPCLCVRLLYRGTGYELILMLYMGIGVVLGHDFPFYLGFRGGKGVASTGAVMLVLDFRVALFCLLMFIIIVAITKYVSVGSISVMILFFIILTYMSRMGYMPINTLYVTEFNILCLFITGFTIFMHRANIKRLIAGNENKIGVGKLEK